MLDKLCWKPKKLHGKLEWMAFLVTLPLITSRTTKIFRLIFLLELSFLQEMDINIQYKIDTWNTIKINKIICLSQVFNRYIQANNLFTVTHDGHYFATQPDYLPSQSSEFIFTATVNSTLNSYWDEWILSPWLSSDDEWID